MSALLQNAWILTPDFPAVLKRRLKALPVEQRWSIAGLLLAQLMIVALYLILVDNMAQVETKRRVQEEQARERHQCGLLASRLERAQCLQTLLIEHGDATTVVAQR